MIRVYDFCRETTRQQDLIHFLWDTFNKFYTALFDYFGNLFIRPIIR